MICVILDDQLVMAECSFVIVLCVVQDLSEPEVGRHIRRIQFDAMLKVFLRLLIVAIVCQLGGEMDGSSEVRLVKRKALLIELNRVSSLLVLLVQHAYIEIDVRILMRKPQRNLELFDGFVYPSLFLVDFA